uniref:Serine/threonine-protein phosphatase n=1 Tax=Ciona savignyi TaxID=51511 RepID=H2Z6Q5_CIOSA
MAECAVNGDSDVLIRAEKFKEEANQLFKDKKYEEAVELYTRAIEANPKSSVYHANRSFAHLRLENYGFALEDASTAIACDKKYIKAYYRRASAYMSLGKFKPALRDLEAVVKVRPTDKDARMKYNACSKIVKQKAFEKAIACDDNKKPVSETINLENISESLGLYCSFYHPFSCMKLSRGLQNNIKKYLFIVKMIKTFIIKNNKIKGKNCRLSISLSVRYNPLCYQSPVKLSQKLDNKLTVCGDVHGQYYDLCHVFDINGLPSLDNPYLFNGDFVDRGSWSVEVILVLLGYKVLYPHNFHLVRGNHETDYMNQMYGFEGEVKAKYDGMMMQLFSEVFNWLPLSYCVNRKVLIMHGGLMEQDNVTLEDLRSIDRNRQPPESGLMCDLLWSDPQMQSGRGPSKRGVSCQFGPDITSKFLKHNELDYIIRSHECKNGGYEEQHNGKCITIFSAPNYCDQMGNKGAFITLRSPDLKPKFTQFDASIPIITISKKFHPEVQPMAYANSFMRM